MEPNTLVQCPYDQSHWVRVSRLPYHLVRCEKNHLQASRRLATCPFNARHRIPRRHLQGHLGSCPDRHLLDAPQDIEDMPWSTLGTPPEPPKVWQPPTSRENWEAELDTLEELPPFVLSVTNGDLPDPCDRSVPAAPPSQGRAGGATGPPKGLAQGGPSAVLAGAEPCPAQPRDRGHPGGQEGLQRNWGERRGGRSTPKFEMFP